MKNKMKKVNFEICESGKENVGVFIEQDNSIKVLLPIGYRVVSEDIQSEELKKEIRTFLKLLCKSADIEYKGEKQKEEFNIISAINVIEDFLEYGLYKQVQRECKLNSKGRINWKRTINTPQLYIDGKMIYQNIYKETINYFAQKEIQDIQKYCLNQISDTIGFLFDFSYNLKPNMEFNETEMIDIINKELKSINEDIKTKMLKDLLDFIANTNFDKIGKNKVYIKYKLFEHIWQELVDVFGIKGKEEYYPKAGYYSLETDEEVNITVNSQIPDTIIKNYKNYEEYVFVLDAKYYRIKTFPNEYDIFKQIRYGQYAQNKVQKENPNLKVINAFILPNNLGQKIVEIQEFYARLEENKNEKIYVVYVDTKGLIHNTKEVMGKVIEELVKLNK